MNAAAGRALSDDEIEAFVEDGVVRIEGAFSAQVAAEARAIMWRDLAEREDDPRTWTRPVARLGMYGQAPFQQAASAPVLQRAYDQLVGAGRWLPSRALGTFPVRFPSPDDAGDTGWHVDMSFGTEAPEFLDWRVNVSSRGRALLMLFLFSDVDEDEAPTRVRVGSHVDVARRLAPAGDAGLTLRELAAGGFTESAHRPERLATGPAGTVYLCHPFLVHAAQAHRGRRPRFLAQPPLVTREPLRLDRAAADSAPVERAILRALR